MERRIRRQTKVKAFEPTLDIDEFNSLTDVLFELLKENSAGCARVCGVSRITWKKWEHTPPTWPWWNLVLRHIILHYLSSLYGRRGLTKKHRAKIMDRFNAIPKPDDFMGEIDQLADNVSGAQTHLRRLLGGGGMFWDEIRKPKNCGGYEQSTLKRAARKLGLIKTQEGYGEHKRSFWRLPTVEDD